MPDLSSLYNFDIKRQKVYKNSIFIYLYMCLNSDGSSQTCWSPMGHVGLRRAFNQACRSSMKHVEVFDGSRIRHVGDRWVSNINNIFVNSVRYQNLYIF